MPTAVGEQVQQFYNKTPFPDYELDRFNSKTDIINAAQSFARTLDKSIPESASVIDIGTGTGQLSALLSLRRKCVWGIDFSDSSLNKAKALKSKLKLNSLTLKKVDILDAKQIESIEAKFDYVLCMGVLHHTGDAYSAFKNILHLLKPNGFLVIGLYNRFGRIPLNLRKFFVNNIVRSNPLIKNYFLKMQIGNTTDKEKIQGWWSDQYLHVHETTHTVGEVLKWFKENGIEYYQTLPSSSLFSDKNSEIAGVWNRTGEIYPYLPIRTFKQLTWIWKTHHEGGYWLTFGRKKS